MAWARWSVSAAAQAPPTAPAPAPTSSTVDSEDPSSDEDDPGGEPIIWEVIGGGRNSGLQVRTGQSFSSPVASLRLSTGALVRQRRLLGNRLHYALLEGAGPPHGWVTISLGNKALLVLKSCKEEAGEEEEEQAAEAARGSSRAPECGTDGAKALAGGGSGEVEERSSSDQTKKIGVGGGEGAGAVKAAVACSSCHRDFRWSDFAEGDYAEGWDCENMATCGNGSFNCGPFRWFCDRCQVDVCRQCFERRQGQVACRGAQASKPSSKFAWDHPLSQAEGRVRCLASDTVAGNMRRLTELQDRNADLEAERGVLLARMEHLEGLLRRCCQPPSDGGIAVTGSQDLDPKVGGEAAGACVAAEEEAALGGADELSLMLEAPAKGSAVTCLCFGQERSHSDHVLLAIAYADGLAVLYRCGRPGREARSSPLASAGSHPLFPRMDASAGDGGTGSLPSHPLPVRPGAGGPLPAPGSSSANLVVLRRLTGHTRGVSSMSFGPLEEQLLTASRDRSLRIWDVSSGELRAVFTDACLVGAAAFLPLHAGTFVASILGASSLSTPFEEESRPMRHSSRRASLRLVSARTSCVLHALPAASDVHALCFDGSGRFLLAGTRRSSLLALEVKASGDRLLPRLRVHLGVGKVTSIVHAPVAGSCSEDRRRLLIGSEGSEGSQVSVAECVYAPQSAGGHLLSIVAQRQVFASEGPLPLRCCFCPPGAGLLVSGSVDGSLLLCHLDRAPRRNLAAPHRAAVAAVAASSCGTLVASADAKGCVAVWRCRAAGSEADLFAASSPDKAVEGKSLGEKAAASDRVGAKRAKRGTKVKVKLPRRPPSKE